MRAVLGSVSYEYELELVSVDEVALEVDAPELDEVVDPSEVLLEALEEAVVVPDEPEAPEAIASISEAVSHAANKAAIAPSNKNLFMSSPR
jgi:hypothetical protein